MMDIGNDGLTTAALLLAIGFPAIQLLLSEVIQTLRQQGRPWQGRFRFYAIC
jgi:hypothetical protein